nr:metalloregulator ArsR/SmtB family transcription factor [uncultured Holophaga sp.]
MATPFQTLVERLKAVAHPLRLRTLVLLQGGELCVCQLVEALGVPQSSVSGALRELRRSGLIRERREGRWVYVSLAPESEGGPLLAALLEETRGLPEAILSLPRSQAEACGVPNRPSCDQA